MGKNLVSYLFFLWLLLFGFAFAQDSADTNYFKHKYAKALDLYQTKLHQTQNPETKYSLLYKIGDCHYQLGHIDEAINNFRGVYLATRDPALRIKSCAQLVTLLAEGHHYDESFQRAREEFQKKDISSPLKTKIVAHGLYAASISYNQRSFSESEKSDAQQMYLFLKKNINNYFPVKYLDSSHNAYKNSPIKQYKVSSKFGSSLFLKLMKSGQK